MSDDGQPLDREHYDMMSNAGRCDLCGKPIDMESGDNLVLSEFGVDDEVKAEHGITDRQAIDAVADAMDRVAESGAGYELARVIRENGAYKLHRECLDDTNYSMLETEVTSSE